jgi:hypothetical protein
LVREEGIERIFFGAAAPLGLLSHGLRRSGANRLVALTHGHEVWWAKLWPFKSLLRHIGSGLDVMTYLGEYTRKVIGGALKQENQRAMVHLAPGIDTEHFSPRTDIAALRMRAEEIGDVRLIIIDPPSAYLGPKVDAYKESDVRRVLAPLTQLAHDTGALVVLVVHLNKRSDGGAQQRFGGSTAWVAAPRAAFLVTEEESTRRRYMLPVKNNLGNDRLGFEYRVAETLLNYRSGPIKAPFIEWLGMTNRSATELLNPPKPKESGALDEAKEFLNGQLAGGTKPAADVKAAATDAGISEATLNRAKTNLRVKSTKVENVWNWGLRSIFND